MGTGGAAKDGDCAPNPHKQSAAKPFVCRNLAFDARIVRLWADGRTRKDNLLKECQRWIWSSSWVRLFTFLLTH